MPTGSSEKFEQITQNAKDITNSDADVSSSEVDYESTGKKQETRWELIRRKSREFVFTVIALPGIYFTIEYNIEHFGNFTTWGSPIAIVILEVFALIILAKLFGIKWLDNITAGGADYIKTKVK